MQLHLLGELTIHRIAEQHAALLAQAAALDDDAPATLDLKGVTEIDSAGVQLLLALRRHLARQGRALTVDGCHDDVKQALDTYHLDSLTLTARADTLHVIPETIDD